MTDPELLSTDDLYVSPTQMFRISEGTYLDPESAQTYKRHGVYMSYPGAVVVLPLFDDGTVGFVRQYRHVAREALLELPAGRVDAEETWAEAAQRELREETGHRAETLTRLAEVLVSPGWTDERQVLFVARGLTPDSLEQDAFENVRLERWPLELVRVMVADGRLKDSKSLATIAACVLAGLWG